MLATILFRSDSGDVVCVAADYDATHALAAILDAAGRKFIVTPSGYEKWDAERWLGRTYPGLVTRESDL